MRSLLTKVALRRLELAEFLYRTKDEEISLRDLTTYFKTSKRVIKEDFSYLESTYSFIQIDGDASSVEVEFQQPYAIENVYQHILKTELPFKILHYLFFHPSVDVEELHEDLFVSASTVYRSLNALNDVLKAEYDLEISTQPIQITGNEANIRMFYYHFFTELCPDLSWPFETVNRKLLQKMLEYSIQTLNLRRSLADYYFKEYIFAINLIRLQQGFLLDKIDQELLPQLKPLVEDTNKPVITPEVEQQMGMKMDFSFYEQTCFTLGEYHPIESYPDMIMMMEEDQQLTASHDYLNKFFGDLSNQFGLYLPNRVELILLMHNHIYAPDNTLSSYYILNERPIHLLKSIRDLNPDFYAVVQAGLVDFLEIMLQGQSPTRKNKILKEIIPLMYFNWWNLFSQLRALETKVEVVILNKTSAALAELTQHMFMENYNSQANFDIYEYKQLDVDYLNNSKYQIIITNFPIKGIKDKIIISSDIFPNQDNFKDLQQALFDCQEKPQESPALWDFTPPENSDS